MRYDLAIFDYDGTLADSKQAILETMSHAMQASGGGPIVEAQIVDWIGLPLENMVAQLLNWSKTNTQVRRADVLNNYRAAYPGFCTKHTQLFDGMGQVLRRAREAGLKLAVATSKARAGFLHSSNNLQILPLFHTVRTAESVQQHKPHPEMLLSILEELAIPPERAIMIGDTEYDMEMGRRANMHTVAVTYGVHPVARLQAQSPTFMVSKAADIWPILRG